MASNERSKSELAKDIGDFIREAKNKFEENEDEIRKAANFAQEHLQDAKEEADEAGKDAKAAQNELAEGEEQGNVREEKEAEEREAQAEKEAEAAEQDEEASLEAEETQIADIRDQEQIIENVQEEGKQLFEEALQDLGGIYERFQKIQSDEYDTQLSQKDYDQVEVVLDRFEQALYLLNTSIEMIIELTQEVERVEKEESMVENISAELSQELEFMEKTDKELMNVFAQLQDSEGEQKAQAEAEELKEEEQQEAQEEQEEAQIDQMLRQEDAELEQLIKQDKELLDYVQKSIDGLEDLYRLLEQEKSIWNNVIGTAPPLKDIQQVHNELRQSYGADEKKISSAENEQSRIKNIMPSGPSGQKAARAGISIAKYGVIAVVVLVVVLMMMWGTPNL